MTSTQAGESGEEHNARAQDSLPPGFGAANGANGNAAAANGNDAEKQGRCTRTDASSTHSSAHREAVGKFRGIPEDVRLFEVFWEQIVQLIRARPDLSIQDITALLVSLANLSLSCYPDKLEYVDQVLAFWREKVVEFEQSPDLHSPRRTTHLNSLLLSPINSYLTVLTLLALPSFLSLLSVQPYTTRKSIAQAVSSCPSCATETVMSTPEDVSGVLDCAAPSSATTRTPSSRTPACMQLRPSPAGTRLTPLRRRPEDGAGRAYGGGARGMGRHT